MSDTNGQPAGEKRVEEHVYELADDFRKSLIDQFGKHPDARQWYESWKKIYPSPAAQAPEAALLSFAFGTALATFIPEPMRLMVISNGLAIGTWEAMQFLKPMLDEKLNEPSKA